MKLEHRLNLGRCAFCHDDLSGPIHVCPGCRAGYHEDCMQLELLGKCGTPGCSTAPSPGSLPVDPRMLCCTAALPNEVHFECSRCRAVAHERCLQRSGPCCAGASYEAVEPRRADPERSEGERELAMTGRAARSLAAVGAAVFAVGALALLLIGFVIVALLVL